MEILLNNFDEEALERLRKEFRKSVTDGLVFEEFVFIMVKALPHLYKLQRPVASIPRTSSFLKDEAMHLLDLMTPDRLWKAQQAWDEVAERQVQEMLDHNGRITRKQFDILAAERTERVEHTKLVRLVVLLRDLFDEIDVNGDGIMEWDEFTGYCVELGFVATRRQTKPLEFKFAVDSSFTDTISKGPQIQQLTYVPERDNIFVVESSSSTLAVYDANLKLVRIFEPPPSYGGGGRSLPAAGGAGAGGGGGGGSGAGAGGGAGGGSGGGSGSDAARRMPPSIGAATIRCVTYVPTKNWVAVATSDQRLSYYDCNIFQLRHGVHTPVQQAQGMWSELAQVLVTGGSDGSLYCWDVNGKKTYDPLPKHKGAITGLVEIPMHKCIASCSTDGRMFLWDLSKHKVAFKGELKGGHKRAVKSMAFSAQNDLLITAGFEYEAIGWDLATRCPMLRLKGHRKSLVAVSVVAMSGGTERALTADLEGTFKLWEIRRTLTGMAPCLQTIDVSMQPATMEFVSSNGCIISASSKMHILRPVKQKVQRDIPVCAIYNSVSMTICVAAGRNVRIYDATNGALRNEFFDIVPDEITSVCLDHRQRKFIVGTAGGQVQVHNYLNGAPMKTFDFKHDRDISALLYCREDKVLMTTGWDRRVCIYDETPRESVSLLRLVNKAHERDIGCLGFSHRLSLIATGSADFTVRLWDFQLAKRVAVLRGHASEISCVTFCDPHAMLLSADSLGNIFFWHVRPANSTGGTLRAVLRNATRESDPEARAAAAEAEEAKERELIRRGHSLSHRNDDSTKGGPDGSASNTTFLTALASEGGDAQTEMSSVASEGEVGETDEDESAVGGGGASEQLKKQGMFTAAVTSMVIVRLSRQELEKQQAAYRVYQAEMKRQRMLDPHAAHNQDKHQAEAIAKAVEDAESNLTTGASAPAYSAAAPAAAESAESAESAGVDSPVSPQASGSHPEDGPSSDAEESGDAVGSEKTKESDPSEIMTFLYTGDDAGALRCWDLTDFLKDMEALSPIPADEQLPFAQPSYNPHRRIVDNVKAKSTDAQDADANAVSHRAAAAALPPPPAAAKKKNNFASVRMTSGDAGSPSATDGRSPRDSGGAASSTASGGAIDLSPNSPLLYNFPCVHTWAGHKGSIRSLELIERPQCLLTASQDMSVRLWSLQGVACGVVSDANGSASSGSKKHGQKGTQQWNFPVNRSSEEELKMAEAEDVLAALGAKEAAKREAREREALQLERHREWQIKKLQDEEAARKAAAEENRASSRPVVQRRTSLRHQPSPSEGHNSGNRSSSSEGDSKKGGRGKGGKRGKESAGKSDVRALPPAKAKPRRRLRPKQRDNILGQLASATPETGGRSVKPAVALREETDAERYERMKEIPKSFQRLQSVPVSAYKNFLSEWRRAPGGPPQSEGAGLGLEPSPFLREKLGKKLAALPSRPAPISKGVRRAATAAGVTNIKRRQLKKLNSLGAQGGDNNNPSDEEDDASFVSLGSRTSVGGGGGGASSVGADQLSRGSAARGDSSSFTPRLPVSPTSSAAAAAAGASNNNGAAGLRARGLQSPWRLKSDELLQRVDILAMPAPDSLLRDDAPLESVFDEEKDGGVLERTQLALSRFDRLTAEEGIDLPSVDLSQPEYFGAFSLEDVKKLHSMMDTLGLESDGTFNWDKLSSLEEWRDHPMRTLMSALNLNGAVPAWQDNIEYMVQQLEGKKAKPRKKKPVDNKDKKRKHFGPYTIKEVLELKMLFDSMDEDGSGEIDAQEFLSSPAWQSSHLFATASTVFNTIDADHDGKITLHELLAITFPGAKPSERKAMKEYLDVVSVTKPVVKTRERKLDKVELEEIEEMFRVFDLDGNGTVSINELIETLKMMGSYGADFLSIEDLQTIASKYDTDGDKDLNLQEFKELMKSHYLNSEPGFV